MKVLCVLNPRSADGAAMQRWPLVAGLLGEFGIEHDLVATPNAPLGDEVVARLKAAPPGAYDAIAGIGGDGTHSAILNALMHHADADPTRPLPPYAFIPLGTGNDLAKSFGLNAREVFLASDLRRAVATIRYGADLRLDLGTLNGTYFADAVTIGVDSRILHERNVRRASMARSRLLRWMMRGRTLYAWCLGPIFWSHPSLRARVEVDGRDWYEGPILNLVVNNTRIYAGGFDFSAHAYANDGLLDVVLFTGRTDYLSRYLLALRHNPERIRDLSERLSRVANHIQGRVIRLELANPEAAQLDGEELPAASRFDIGIRPGAIWIKTPVGPS